MTKVLFKAFGILEEVAKASPEPLSLKLLAKSLGMNKATCSRLACELAENGYLEQVSRQTGFAVGPRAWSLGSRCDYAKELREAAEEPLASCAEELGQSVLLAIFRQGVRYILLHRNCNRGLRVELRESVYNDCFSTATGILLLAYGSEEDFAAAKEKSPRKPHALWEEQGGDEAKETIFAKAREEGFFIRDSASCPLAAAAFPVFEDGRCVASLGVSAPRAEFAKDRERILRLGAEKARLLSERLRKNSSL